MDSSQIYEKGPCLQTISALFSQILKHMNVFEASFPTDRYLKDMFCNLNSDGRIESRLFQCSDTAKIQHMFSKHLIHTGSLPQLITACILRLDDDSFDVNWKFFDAADSCTENKCASGTGAAAIAAAVT